MPPDMVYKYVTLETARLILTSGQLRFQSPVRYNDPLDSQWNMLWPLFTPEAIEYRKSAIKSAIQNPRMWPNNIDPQRAMSLEAERRRLSKMSAKERKVAINAIIDDFADVDHYSNHLQSYTQERRRRLRVLCFSEAASSSLMWAHYAGQHTGVALGFSTSLLEVKYRRPLEPVRYSISPPCLINHKEWTRSIIFGLPTPPMTGDEREWALTKHNDWRYECEWRFVWIMPEGTPSDYDDFPFPHDSLREVVFGCRADPARSSEIVTLAKDINPLASTYMMSIQLDSFELVRNRIAV